MTLASVLARVQRRACRAQGKPLEPAASPLGRGLVARAGQRPEGDLRGGDGRAGRGRVTPGGQPLGARAWAIGALGGCQGAAGAKGRRDGLRGRVLESRSPGRARVTRRVWTWPWQNGGAGSSVRRGAGLPIRMRAGSPLRACSHPRGRVTRRELGPVQGQGHPSSLHWALWRTIGAGSPQGLELARRGAGLPQKPDLWREGAGSPREPAREGDLCARDYVFALPAGPLALESSCTCRSAGKAASTGPSGTWVAFGARV